MRFLVSYPDAQGTLWHCWLGFKQAVSWGGTVMSGPPLKPHPSPLVAFSDFRTDDFSLQVRQILVCQSLTPKGVSLRSRFFSKACEKMAISDELGSS